MLWNPILKVKKKKKKKKLGFILKVKIIKIPLILE